MSIRTLFRGGVTENCFPTFVKPYILTDSLRIEVVSRNFFLQDLQDAIVKLRTSHTQNRGTAVVSLTPRSGFMMWG